MECLVYGLIWTWLEKLIFAEVCRMFPLKLLNGLNQR